MVLKASLFVLQNGDVERGLGNDVRCEKANLTDETQPRKLLPLIKKLFLFTVKVIVLLVILVTVVGLIWYFMGWIFVIQLILVAIVAYFAAGGGYKWLYIVYKTLPRDLT